MDAYVFGGEGGQGNGRAKRRDVCEACSTVLCTGCSVCLLSRMLGTPMPVTRPHPAGARTCRHKLKDGPPPDGLSIPVGPRTLSRSAHAIRQASGIPSEASSHAQQPRTRPRACAPCMAHIGSEAAYSARWQCLISICWFVTTSSLTCALATSILCLQALQQAVLEQHLSRIDEAPCQLVVQQSIGRGGQGTVYKGTWAGSPAAIKVRGCVRKGRGGVHVNAWQCGRLIVHPGKWLGSPAEAMVRARACLLIVCVSTC